MENKISAQDLLLLNRAIFLLTMVSNHMERDSPEHQIIWQFIENMIPIVDYNLSFQSISGNFEQKKRKDS